jgi:leucyl-tRNA synthetase
VDVPDAFKRTWHRTIKKVTDDYENLRFNVAISQMMIFVNEAYKLEQVPRAALADFVKLLSPIAPHLAEELWARLNGVSGEATSTISYEPWPTYDEAWTVDRETEIVVQIKGKIVDRLNIPTDMTPADMEKVALASEKVQTAIGGRTVRKVIAVPGKLVNIVV